MDTSTKLKYTLFRCNDCNKNEMGGLKGAAEAEVHLI